MGVRVGVLVGVGVKVKVGLGVGVQVNPEVLVTALDKSVAGWVSKFSSSAMLVTAQAQAPVGGGPTVTLKESVPDTPAAR